MSVASGSATRARPSTQVPSRSGTGGSEAPKRAQEMDRERSQDRRGHTHSSSSGSAGAANRTTTVTGPARSSAMSPGTSRASTPAAASLPSRPSTAAEVAAQNGTNGRAVPIKSPMPSSATARQVQPQTSPLSPKFAPPAPVSLPPKPTPPTPTEEPTPAQTTSPTAAIASGKAYQPSSQAQALLDDVRARRESTTNAFVSPFPDLDRTLAALNSNDGFSFSFNIDPTLASKSMAGKGRQSPSVPVFRGSFDPFAGSSFGPSQTQATVPTTLPPPPGLASRPTINTQPSSSTFSNQPMVNTPTRLGPLSSYSGSFDPFAEAGASAASGSPALSSSNVASSLQGFDDESRRASRFGFARRGGGPGGDGLSARLGLSAASSPMGASEGLPQTPLYTSSDVLSPMPSASSQQLPQWTLPTHQEYGPPGMSPMMFSNGRSTQQQHQHHQAQQQTPNMNGMDSFSPFASGADMSLKEMLNIGRHQQGERRGQYRYLELDRTLTEMCQLKTPPCRTIRTSNIPSTTRRLCLCGLENHHLT